MVSTVGEVVLAPSWSWGEVDFRGMLGSEEIERVWLRLPTDWQPYIDSLMEGAPAQEVLDEIVAVEGMDEVEGTEARRHWEWVLDSLFPLRGREVRCYRDPLGQLREREHSMEVLLLTLRGRAFSLDVDAWRQALEEEALSAVRELRGEASRLEARPGLSLCLEPGPGTEMFLGMPHRSLGPPDPTPLGRLRLLFIRAALSGERPGDDLLRGGVRAHLEMVGRVQRGMPLAPPDPA